MATEAKKTAAKKTAAKTATAKKAAEKPAEEIKTAPGSFEEIDETAPENTAAGRDEMGNEAEKAKTAEPVIPTIYQVVAPKEPMVKMLYIDSCIANNQIPIGKGRVITGSGKTFSVTLADFEGEFMTAFIQKLIKKRLIIVLDGVTDEMRAQYGCKYAEGEIIRNEGIFDYLLNCTAAEAEKLFGELCPEHRELVARRFMDAFESGDNRLDRARVEALNNISKGDSPDGTGAFTPILKAIAEKI